MPHYIKAHYICAYALQIDCEEGDKDAFWCKLEEGLSSLPDEERLIVGVNLNGHVGIIKEGELPRRVYGGWGMSKRNEEGEKVVYLFIKS